METSERILSKAHDLFMRYGIRSVSMDEIAAHLGISKKTIYQFYADKDALIEDVIVKNIKVNEQQSTIACEASENAIHEIFLAVEHVQEMLNIMNPLIVYDVKKYHPNADRVIVQHKSKFIYNLIKVNLEKGIKEELYRSDIDIEIITRLRLNSVFLIFDSEAFPHGKYSLSHLIEEISDHFLFGIATPKGVKLIQKYIQQRQKK